MKTWESMQVEPWMVKCQKPEGNCRGVCKNCGRNVHNGHVMYAAYSEAASQLTACEGSCNMGRTTSGAALYKTPDGGEVWVTGVFEDPECSGYNWPDKVMVGQVVTGTMCGWREGNLERAESKVAVRPPKIGDKCGACGHEVRERALLTSTFIGCMC